MDRSRLLLTLVVVGGALAAGVHGLIAQTTPAVYVAEQAPAALQPAIAHGQAAMRALQSSLQTRLVETMPKAGPAGALDVCRREAYSLAAEIGAQQGVSLGRTSHKVRNPQNAPKPWAAPIVAENATKKAADVKAYVVDLGDKVGLLQPIAMGEACSLCHGNAAWMPDDVAKTLKENYPNDQASGFKTGDVRGWVWAEVPKK